MTNLLPKFPQASPPIIPSPVTASPEPAKLSSVARHEQRIIELRSQIGALQKDHHDALMDADFDQAKRFQSKIATLVNRLQKARTSLQAAIEKHDRRTDAELLIQLRKVMGCDNRMHFVHCLSSGDYDQAAAMLRAIILR
jgi:protein subunit release factor A